MISEHLEYGTSSSYGERSGTVQSAGDTTGGTPHTFSLALLVTIRVHLRTGTGFFSNILNYFRLFSSFLFMGEWKPWNLGTQILASLGWSVTQTKMDCNLLHNLYCALSCSSTAWFHVNGMSQSIASVSAQWQAHNVWHHSPAPLFCSFHLSVRKVNATQQQRPHNRCFVVFVSVVICNHFGKVLP